MRVSVRRLWLLVVILQLLQHVANVVQRAAPQTQARCQQMLCLAVIRSSADHLPSRVTRRHSRHKQTSTNTQARLHAAFVASCSSANSSAAS